MTDAIRQIKERMSTLKPHMTIDAEIKWEELEWCLSLLEQSDEWQPIETAPKDGTRFLAYGTAYGDYGYTPDEVGMVFMKWPNRFEKSPWLDQPSGRYANGFKATHWQPLPEPPKEAGDE